MVVRLGIMARLCALLILTLSCLVAARSTLKKETRPQMVHYGLGSDGKQSKCTNETMRVRKEW